MEKQRYLESLLAAESSKEARTRAGRGIRRNGAREIRDKIEVASVY